MPCNMLIKRNLTKCNLILSSINQFYNAFDHAKILKCVIMPVIKWIMYMVYEMENLYKISIFKFNRRKFFLTLRKQIELESAQLF